MKNTAANILIVDDSETDATIMQQALQNLVMENKITTLDSATAAIKLLNKKEEFQNTEAPDLIMLDLNMPDFNGLEFLSVVKKDPRFLNIPIIILSSSEKQEDINQCYKLGANCFITKPNDISKFRQTIAVINEFWLGIARLPRKEG